MADQFWDGFDKYGTNGAIIWTPSTNVQEDAGALLFCEWATGGGGTNLSAASLTTGRFAGSLAFNLTGAFGSGTVRITRPLNGNIPTVIFGVAIRSQLASNEVAFVTLGDTGTDQMSIGLNTAGLIEVRRGGPAGTLLATQTGTSVLSGSWHYLEASVTIHNTAGAWTVNLDNNTILTATAQNTRSSANNWANSLSLAGCGSSANGVAYDDLYCFDSTGTVNNAVRGDSRIETLFPTSDNSVQFTPATSYMIGYPYFNNTTTTGVNEAANQIYVALIVPTINMTLNSISVSIGIPNASANIRPVVYGDTSGHAGTLLSAGSTVTGVGNIGVLTMPLTTPQSLVAGTHYWIGFMNDVAMTQWLTRADSNNSGNVATTTFTSGAPATAPAMTTGQVTRTIWGNATATIPNNTSIVSMVPPGANGTPPIARMYLADTTATHQDLYNMADLSGAALNFAGVKVSALTQRMDAGIRTMDLRISSSGVLSSGNTVSIIPNSSLAYMSSYFDTDPNTSAAWTQTGINAMLAGFRLDT